MSAAAGAVFLAVCAYMGAALMGGLSPRETTARVCRAVAADSAELQGMIIREEQVICSSDAFPGNIRSGERIQANTPLNDDGSLTAPCAGVFFSRCDGYENLCGESLRGLTVPELETLLTSPPEKTGDAKLVTAFAWYYAALADETAPLAENTRCTLVFDGDIRAQGTLVYRSPAENGKQAAVFRLTCGGELLARRFCGAEVIFAEHEGLCIPASAVMKDENGEEYVMTVSAGGSRRTDVDIIYSDGELCLAAFSRDADGLRDGSTVICPG